MKVLIKFNHGLGDCVQFTSVLQHIKKYRPDWKVTLQTNAGKHTVGIGLCECATSDKEIEYIEKFDSIRNIAWWECHEGYGHIPSTKVERALKDEFQIEPDISLLSYKQEIRQEAIFAAEAYFRSIGAAKNRLGKYKVVIIHYQGNTSTEKKNFNHDIAKLICDRAIELNHIPIILDWDNRSPLPDNKKIFCPDKNHPLWNDLGTGDAETIAALISLSNLCISIDSGPGHVAGATHTPTLIVWNKHHPVHYYTPTDNVQHMIPYNHKTHIRSNLNQVVAFFENNYRFIKYTNLSNSIFDWMENMLQSPQEKSELIQSGDFFIRRDNAEQDMVIVRDIYDGDSYKLSLIPGIIQQAKLVVDIGAHIGSFAKLVHKLNPSTKIICVEVCPENIECLKKNIGDFALIINAACTYEEGELMLLNSVRPNCESTGGSTVIPKEVENTEKIQEGYRYWSDYRPIRKVTLEEIAQGEKIDLLKLDCECAEFSILGNTPSLDSIRFIVGEYHEKNKWSTLVKERFSNWDYGKMYAPESSELGTFHLSNRNWPPVVESSLASRLRKYIKQGDIEIFNQNIPWYEKIFSICGDLKPDKVVEFGVRAGYSARAVLEACPNCKIIGYESDVDEPSKGYWKHAQEIVPGYEIFLMDTMFIGNIPICDLVLVDADHSFLGCHNEIIIASRSAKNILIDDINNQNVRNAVDKFLSENQEWKSEIGERIAYLCRK